MRKSFLIWFALLTATALPACSSVATMHMLVPSRAANSELLELSRKPGVLVNAILVSGEEKQLLISPGAPNELAGSRMPEGDAITLPFDSLALVYYADAGKNGAPPAKTAINSFPKLQPPDAGDHDLTCPQLDTELARAAALRWYARNQGFLPLTASQRFGHDAAVTGIAVALTVAVVAAAAGGAGGPCLVACGQESEPTGWLVGKYQWRTAIGAADGRIVGLLKLKAAKGCAAVPTLTEGTTDLQILAQLEEPPPAASEFTLAGEESKRRLVQRTMVLDKLGPAKLPDFRPVRAADEPILLTYPKVLEFDGVAQSGAHGFPGVLLASDRALSVLELDNEGTLLIEHLHADYSQIASVDVQRDHHICLDVIRMRDGRVATVFVKSFGCEQAEALKSFLASRIGATT